jgi:hypothetical protein
MSFRRGKTRPGGNSLKDAKELGAVERTAFATGEENICGVIRPLLEPGAERRDLIQQGFPMFKHGLNGFERPFYPSNR